jgi:hypothetical protein
MKPGWRWLVIAAALIVAVLVVSEWKTERSPHQPEPAPTPPSGRLPQDAAKSELNKTPATPQLPRERPERGRTERP